MCFVRLFIRHRLLFITWEGGGMGGVGAFYLGQNETYLTPPPLLAYPPPMYSVSDKLSNLPSPRKPKHSSPQKKSPLPIDDTELLFPLPFPLLLILFKQEYFISTFPDARNIKVVPINKHLRLLGDIKFY